VCGSALQRVAVYTVTVTRTATISSDQIASLEYFNMEDCIAFVVRHFNFYFLVCRLTNETRQSARENPSERDSTREKESERESVKESVRDIDRATKERARTSECVSERERAKRKQRECERVRERVREPRRERKKKRERVRQGGRPERRDREMFSGTDFFCRCTP